VIIPMQANSRWRTCAIVLLLLSTSCCGVLPFGWFSFPPTGWITRHYFDAIVAGDLTEAMKYTAAHSRFPGCVEATQQEAQGDINAFGGAEVRNIVITVLGSGGSDHTIQVGRVQFEYRRPGEAQWQPGYTQVLTTYDEFGFRYTCGKYP
jgi:hypothetical protein